MQRLIMCGGMVAVSAATTVRSDAPASATRRPLTERRMARTRRELADAAARMFIERGYDAHDRRRHRGRGGDLRPHLLPLLREQGRGRRLALALGVEEIVDALRAVPLDKPAAGSAAHRGHRGLPARGGESGADPLVPADGARHPGPAGPPDAGGLRQQQNLASCLASGSAGRPTDLRVTLISGAVVMAINTAFERWADQSSTVGDPGPRPLVNKALAELTTPLLPD